MRRTLFLLILILFVFSGCETVNVTVFHVLPENPSLTKYAFTPFESQKGSLEYASYQNLIRSELSKRQFVEVPFEKATVVVKFGYAVGGASQKIGSVPVFGETGVASSTTYIHGGHGSYYAYTTHRPSYGIKGYQPYSYTVYSRELWMHIVDKASLITKKTKMLYEAKVESEGRSNQLATVMLSMVKALFKEFPGKSGSTRTEFITPDGRSLDSNPSVD